MASADLAVTKADWPDPVFVGSNLTYTIVVTNNGPSPATGVIMTDTLPASVTFVSAASTKGTCSQSGTLVTCDIGLLAVGETVTVTIVVIPTTPGTISDIAFVRGNEHDPVPANNTATQDTVVLVAADLAVTKADSPDPVFTGEDLTYTVTVTNNGPSPATDVIMTDTLPAIVTFVSAVSTKGTCSQSGTLVTCDIGPLAVNEVVTVTIVVIPMVPGTISDTATVSGNEYDPNPDNNTATQYTTVRAAADLAVTKYCWPDPVFVGERLTYTILATNNGPSPASGVTVNDTLPSSITFVSASSTKGTCSYSGRLVTCVIGSMAVGETVTITIVVIPATAGILLSIIRGDEFESDQSNNITTQDTVAPAPVDHVLTKKRRHHRRR